MTAHRLQPVPSESPQYAVVGACSAVNAVFHVGILADLGTLAHGQKVAVFHMAGPPDRIELPGIMRAHAVGWIHDLTPEEQGSIEDWLDELKIGSIRVEYFACPASDTTKDPNGRIIGRRFSCAGFVYSCFAEALPLKLVADEEELPEAGLALLEKVWGPIVREQGHLVLQGPGPSWRVLLPSYLFYALSLEREAMPHRPAHADACFPPAGPPVPAPP